jgi:hypothetical protein
MSAPVTIERQPLIQSIAVTASISTTGTMVNRLAGGGVLVPAGSNLSLLTWYGCSTDSATAADWLPIYDRASPATPAAMTSTVAASQAHPIPDECFGYPFLRAVGNTTGTVTVCTKG